MLPENIDVSNSMDSMWATTRKFVKGRLAGKGYQHVLVLL